MNNLLSLSGFLSFVIWSNTVLAAECTIDNSARTIELNKAAFIISYNFYNCKKKIKSSEYRWLDTKDRHIIFKSSAYPQDPIYVMHTNQNFTIMGWGNFDHWGTPDELSYKIDYLNFDVRDVEYQIMMGTHLLAPLANYRPGNYETSVKLSVNY